MSITRTRHVPAELQAMGAWIAAQGLQFARRPITEQVVLAQKAVLPVSRQRGRQDMFSQATLTMARIDKAMAVQAAMMQPVMAPVVSVGAPSVPQPAQPMPTVYLQHGTTVLVGMPRGTYLLEVM